MRVTGKQRGVFVRLLILLAALFFLTAASEDKFDYYTVDKENWYDVKKPTKGDAKIYGGYVSGCIEGAEQIPSSGVGFKMMRESRGRNFAHPSMIEFIKSLGEKLHKEDNSTLFVSDVSQARGGPPPAGSFHNSHQIGLDADFWYLHKRHPKHAISLLTKDKTALDEKKWSDSYAKLLQEVSSIDEVERIFVNPHIKKKLCEKYSKDKWLSKVRPWWGHHEHFHVRLKCPKGDENCLPQFPVGSDTSCDDSLEWWFSKEAEDKLKEAASKPKPQPKLPTQCQLVYAE